MDPKGRVHDEKDKSGEMDEKVDTGGDKWEEWVQGEMDKKDEYRVKWMRRMNKRGYG